MFEATVMEATSKFYAKDDLIDKDTRWARVQLWPKQQQEQKNYKNAVGAINGIW
jgi:hypothetical protein